MYYRENNLQEATSLVQEGLEELPDNAPLLYRACAYHLAAGRLNEACRYLETALILDYEQHTLLYDFFPDLQVQKTIAKIISQFK